MSEQKQVNATENERRLAETEARRNAQLGAWGSALVRAVLIICAGGMIWYGFAMSAVVEGAIHEIYQLMLVTSGLTLIAILGVWGAVDALRRAVTAEIGKR